MPGRQVLIAIAGLAAGLAAALLLAHAAPADTAPRAAESPSAAASVPARHDFLRGMTVTCPRSGQIWGTPAMSEALDELRRLGVEWVSVHPYARIERDGTVRHRPAATTSFLTGAVERVRGAGLRLFWKPHLAYWGSFSWRGAIDFGDDQAAWERFFAGYREFILDQAVFAQAHGVPLLAVGVELDSTARHERHWRRILAEVRQVYRGEITYAANWDRVETIPFWDAVDLVGVQAYFPLSDDASPSEEELEAAWDAHLGQLTALSRRLGGKPVLFAEIGYNRAAGAAREPWAYDTDDSAENRALRQRLMSVALARLEREPLLRGIFWWKWMPGPFAGRSNFSMRDPEALEVLQRAWGVAPSPAVRPLLPRPAASGAG